MEIHLSLALYTPETQPLASCSELFFSPQAQQRFADLSVYVINLQQDAHILMFERPVT